MDPEAQFWKDRYDTQHRKVHDMEDEIARLRAEIAVHRYGPVEELPRMTSPHVRLYAVYCKLLESTADLPKFRNQVFHGAEVDGWELLMSVSDFGDLIASARTGDVIHGFACDQEKHWHPSFRSTTDETLPWFVDLFERAEVWTNRYTKLPVSK